jgi:hypothetical protein
LLILIILGYAGYQVLRLYLTYGSVSEKVEHVLRVGPTVSDEEIISQLMHDTQEINVQLYPESLFIDRSIQDTIRIYAVYDDSSDIFGVIKIRRHFVVDKIKAYQKM